MQQAYGIQFWILRARNILVHQKWNDERAKLEASGIKTFRAGKARSNDPSKRDGETRRDCMDFNRVVFVPRQCYAFGIRLAN